MIETKGNYKFNVKKEIKHYTKKKIMSNDRNKRKL